MLSMWSLSARGTCDPPCPREDPEGITRLDFQKNSDGAPHQRLLKKQTSCGSRMAVL